MRRWPFLCALGILLVSPSLRAAPASPRRVSIPPFELQLPPGWRDVTQSEVGRNITGRMPQGTAAFVAMPPPRSKETVTELMVASVQRCEHGGRITDETARELAASARKKLQQDQPDASWTLVEDSKLEIGGVAVARMVFDAATNGVGFRMVGFVLPAGSRCAVLHFLARREAFQALLPVFERAAAATTGLADAPPRPFLDRYWRHLAGAGLALLLILFQVFGRRRASRRR